MLWVVIHVATVTFVTLLIWLERQHNKRAYTYRYDIPDISSTDVFIYSGTEGRGTLLIFLLTLLLSGDSCDVSIL